MLEQATNAMQLPGLVVGPIKSRGRKWKGLYKLDIGGRVRLRPLLCKGPENKELELTFLATAFEKDSKFDPPSAPDKAVERRDGILAGTERRIRYETPGPEKPKRSTS